MKRRRRNQKQKGIRICCLISLLLILIIGGIGIYKFRTEHYRKGTVISGIDCSWLTVEEAEEKINAEYSNASIHLFFPNEIYVASGNDFDLRANSDLLKEILSKQNSGDKIRIYKLEDSFYLNTDKVEKVLSEVNSLKPENMHEPKNAYLALGASNFLEIIPEEKGSQIDFGEAHTLMYMCLKDGQTAIDFSELVLSEPEILSTDENLISQKERINKILSTTVNYSLMDDTTFTLDNSIMKDWLITDENGNYDIDIDSNLPNFLTLLSNKVSEASSFVEFNATNLETPVSIPIPERNKPSIDWNSEIENLKIDLLSGETFNRTPIYSGDKSFKNLQSYVEIDTSRQTVWMYCEGECIVETDCVTGTASTKYATPAGWFYLTYKTPNATLRGFNADGSRYNAFVKYWMPFNYDIGLHDASWRRKFGGSIYETDGSHGCINLPSDAAKIIYENLDYTMPIIVYASDVS